MEVLALSTNDLTGEIPRELEGLTKLKVLAAGSIFYLRLVYLDSISSDRETLEWLGDLHFTQSAYHRSNKLSGELPDELAVLTNLEWLDLDNNLLTGPVPVWLSELSNLRQLHLSNNDLTGSIPVELSAIFDLTDLTLQRNSLSGSVPSELGNLANLLHLDLSGNTQLTAPLPAEAGQPCRPASPEPSGNWFGRGDTDLAR